MPQVEKTICTDKPFTCQLSMTDIVPYLKFKADIKSLTIRSCLMLSQSMGFLNSLLVTVTGSSPRFHNWEHFQLFLEKLDVGPFPYKLLCSISKHNPSSFYSHKDCLKSVIVNIGYGFNQLKGNTNIRSFLSIKGENDEKY